MTETNNKSKKHEPFAVSEKIYEMTHAIVNDLSLSNIKDSTRSLKDIARIIESIRTIGAFIVECDKRKEDSSLPINEMLKLKEYLDSLKDIFGDSIKKKENHEIMLGMMKLLIGQKDIKIPDLFSLMLMMQQNKD